MFASPAYRLRRPSCRFLLLRVPPSPSSSSSCRSRHRRHRRPGGLSECVGCACVQRRRTQTTPMMHEYFRDTARGFQSLKTKLLFVRPLPLRPSDWCWWCRVGCCCGVCVRVCVFRLSVCVHAVCVCMYSVGLCAVCVRASELCTLVSVCLLQLAVVTCYRVVCNCDSQVPAVRETRHGSGPVCRVSRRCCCCGALCLVG